ncbi:MAG TPA: hypothetical protein VN721_04950, partial [Flavipsychrobacter sp.]|nr:hypothetical protein [Flavipsychrobacter sp.]
MKSIFYTLLLSALIFTNSSFAQVWSFAKGSDSIGLYIGYPEHVVAAGRQAVLWGDFKKSHMVYGSQDLGDYTMNELDTSGTVGASININGKLYLLDAQTDDSGNYYILGTYYDSVTFSTGFQSLRNPLPGNDPNYFLFRLDKGTLHLSWFKLIGVDYYSTSSNFTIKNNALYMFVDSGLVADNLFKYDLSTGNHTRVLTQSQDGMVTSIQLDAKGNIYVAGGGTVLGPVNFNGHIDTPASALSYPTYIVRYKADGTFDWIQWMRDVTITPRKLTLSGNNQLYYSGPVNDSFALAGITVHHAKWVFAFMVAMLDSTGDVKWLSQQDSKYLGDAGVNNEYHASLLGDTSLCIAAFTRDTIDWGNGVTSITNNNGNMTVVNFASTGLVNWTKSPLALASTCNHIASDGYNVWVTGNGYDSTQLVFGSNHIISQLYGSTPFIAKL